MPNSPYQPIFELTRGDIVESIHCGALAVVDVSGRLVASYGDPDAVTFLRSSAKPFQVMPFLEHGGQAYYHLTPREIAIMCASHAGTDDHVSVLRAIQLKAGVTEADLLCGVHIPFHEPTAEALRERKERPTPNRHNCSGKHTGMLAYVRMVERVLHGAPLGEAAAPANDGATEALDYIDPRHPIQGEILQTMADMCAVPVGEIRLGTDGCSAPNFALPLRQAALGYARLCDPAGGQVANGARLAACQTITAAMTYNPDMVSGPTFFDTRLMEVGRGRIVVKGGAEGYQGIGLMPGALGPGSPAMGIALKIGDGDLRGKARHAVALEVLRQLGALSETELSILGGPGEEFGPSFPIRNWRKILVGEGRPCFKLERS